MQHTVMLLIMLVWILADTALAVATPSDAQNGTVENATAGYVGGFLELGYRLGTVSGSQAGANAYGPSGDGPDAQLYFNKRDGQYVLTFDGIVSGDATGYAPSDAQQSAYDVDVEFEKSGAYRIRTYAERYGHNLSDGLTDKADVGGTVYLREDNATREFTYNRQRTRTGAEAEISLNTPFFARVKVDNLAVQGLLPLYNVNSGNVPYPVDYEVNTVSGQIGYRSDRVTAMFDAAVDSLDNNEDPLRSSTTNGAPSGNVREPVQESSSYRLGGALTWRLPELRSTAMLNASFSQLSSDAMESSRSYRNSESYSSVWDDYTGDIRTTALNGAFTSSPWKGGSTRIYGRYYSRDNQSDIDYNEEWLASVSESNLITALIRDQMALFEYDRSTVGADVTQRLGRFRLQGGMEWEGTDRNAWGVTSVENTDDLQAWGQARAELLDSLSAHVRYGFLDRSSSKTEDTSDGAVTNPSSGVIAEWFGYMHTASRQSHNLKTGLEWAPLDTLTVSLDYVLTLDDYASDTALGYDRGEKHGGLLDVSWSQGPVQLQFFGSVEQGVTDVDSRVYRGTSSSYIGGADPDQADTSTAFNWGYSQHDMTYTVGAGATVDLIKDVLSFQLQYDFAQNDGKTRFDIPAASGVTRADIEDSNDYTMHNLNARLTWNVAAHHAVSLGYVFSKLEYSDWAYNDSVSDEDRLSDGYYNVNADYESHTAGLYYRYVF